MEDIMTIYENIKNGKYNSKVSFPDGRLKQLDPAAYKDAMDDYRRSEAEGERTFKRDLEEEYGVSDLSVKDAFYSFAWDLGHSAGLSEVDIYYSDIVERFAGKIRESNKESYDKGYMDGIRDFKKCIK